jgi:dihydroorotate dehydrogenase
MTPAVHCLPAQAAGDLDINAPAGGVKLGASAWEKVVNGAVQVGVGVLLEQGGEGCGNLCLSCCGRGGREGH